VLFSASTFLLHIFHVLFILVNVCRFNFHSYLKLLSNFMLIVNGILHVFGS